MWDLLFTLLVNSLGIFVIGYLLKGVEMKSFFTAMAVAVVLGLVNFFVKPVIAFLSLPLTILTFGLFILVINALMLMLVDALLDDFKIKNFWWALLFGLILSVLNLGFF
ncbi:MAG: phage holin family protein [Balneolaceae bacterium]|nr:phage holin family protein [Balneolaceae bacterium]